MRIWEFKAYEANKDQWLTLAQIKRLNPDLDVDKKRLKQVSKKLKLLCPVQPRSAVNYGSQEAVYHKLAVLSAYPNCNVGSVPMEALNGETVEPKSN